MRHPIALLVPRTSRPTLAAGVLTGLVATVAAALVGGAPAAAADNPPATANPNGNERAIACAAVEQCALVTVIATTDGTGRTVHAHARMEPYASYNHQGGRVARVQIDSVSIQSLHRTVIARTGRVAPGNRGPAVVDFDGTVPQDGVCRVYGIEVHESVRLTDGTLQHGGYLGGWFIPRQAACPNRGIVSAFQDVTLDGQLDALNNIEGVSVASDHRHLTAFAQVRVIPEGSPSKLARVQIDNVQLLRNGAPVTDAAAPFGPENSGTLTKAGVDLLVVSRSFAAVPNCADYSSRVTYSVRFTDGSLKQFAVVSPRRQFCAT